MNAERARGPTNPVCDSQSQLRAIDEWRRRQPDLTLAIWAIRRLITLALQSTQP
jgi:hypothetical protein